MGSPKQVGGDGSAKNPTPEDVEEFREAIAAGKELENAPDGDDGLAKLDNHLPGVKFLASLLSATIFTDLFAYQADLHFSHPTKQERVQAMVERAPLFYKACRNADYIVRGGLLIVTVGLVGFLGVVLIVRLFIN